MSQPTISLEISPGGEITVEVSGVDGPSCKALTMDLEKSLGKLQDTKLKPEYTSLAAPQAQQQRLGEGL